MNIEERIALDQLESSIARCISRFFEQTSIMAGDGYYRAACRYLAAYNCLLRQHGMPTKDMSDFIDWKEK